ncbi:KH domain-containing protein [Lactovum odontotermitis]
MTDIKELILSMVKPLVSNPSAVSLSIQDGDEFEEYHLQVDQSDLGHVIGRQGRIIQAVRTIIYSIPVEEGKKKIRLLVDQDD